MAVVDPSTNLQRDKLDPDDTIVFEDERFTTMEAERVLISGGVRREDRKRSIDSIAASYILEGYLNKKNRGAST